MTLSAEHIRSISQSVYRKFPEVSGKRPTVKLQAAPKLKDPGAAGQRYLLTFKSVASGPEGKTIHRLVRVVADEHGKILKISTSR